MSPKGPVRYSSHTMACGKGRRDRTGRAAREPRPAPPPPRAHLGARALVEELAQLAPPRLAQRRQVHPARAQVRRHGRPPAHVTAYLIAHVTAGAGPRSRTGRGGGNSRERSAAARAVTCV